MEFNDRRPDGSLKPRHVIERELAERKKMSAPFRLVQKGQGMVHVEGQLDPQTKGGGNDMGDHISYRPDSHCSGLTRLGPMKYTAAGHDTPEAALKALSAGYHGKACTRCTAALQRLV